MDSIGGEDKGIFDVIAFDQSVSHTAYGFSVKSKQLSVNEFKGLSTNGQVYMEIANSPAKFWAEIQSKHGLNERDFREQRYAEDIGKTVISTVEKWHTEGKAEFEGRKAFQQRNPPANLDLDKSCYFCLSYSKVENPDKRQYQIHSFPLKYPSDIVWRYKSESCLSGYVKELDGSETRVIDWYGLSGGQLKYYPRVTAATYSTNPFTLYKPITLEDLRIRARNTEFQA